MSQLKVSPSDENIFVGADSVFITLPGDSAPTHFGHIEPIGINPALDKKELVGHVAGIIGVVKSRDVHKKTDYKFRAYERTMTIVKAAFFGGALSSATQAAATDLTETIEALTGENTGANIMVGGWYPLAKVGVSNVVISDLGSPEVVLVEGTDYKVDYQSGRIAFLRAVTDDETAYTITYDCEAQTQRSFAKFAVKNITCSAEVWRYLEDNKVLEKETLPKCFLAQDGEAKLQPEDNSSIPFNLTQVPHPTLGWGTITQVDRG